MRIRFLHIRDLAALRCCFILDTVRIVRACKGFKLYLFVLIQGHKNILPPDDTPPSIDES